MTTNEEIIRKKFGKDTPYIYKRIAEELEDLMQKAREDERKRVWNWLRNELKKGTPIDKIVILFESEIVELESAGKGRSHNGELGGVPVNQAPDKKGSTPLPANKETRTAPRHTKKSYWASNKVERPKVINFKKKKVNKNDRRNR